MKNLTRRIENIFWQANTNFLTPIILSKHSFLSSLCLLLSTYVGRYLCTENTHRWGKYHCTAGLQFYKFGFNCFTTYMQITSYFLCWSNPVLENWRQAIQWSFPQRWVNCTIYLMKDLAPVKTFLPRQPFICFSNFLKNLAWPVRIAAFLYVFTLPNNFGTHQSLFTNKLSTSISLNHCFENSSCRGPLIVPNRDSSKGPQDGRHRQSHRT